MAKRSLKASAEGIKKAKTAFERRQWTQEYLAAEVGLSTRNSIWKFFSGKPIERYVFIEICFKLDLNWEEIADLPKFDQEKPPEKTSLENNQKTKNIANIIDDDKQESWQEKLRQQINFQCGQVDNCFYLGKKLSLESIYIELYATPLIKKQQWLDISEFNNFSVNYPTNIAMSSSTQTLPISQIVKQFSHLILMGRAGSGKSMLLKYLAINIINNKSNNDLYPIYLSAKIIDYQLHKTNQFDLINYLAYTWQILGINQQQIELLAKEGKILILLDGLEKISLNYRQIILTEIEKFISLYHQNKIIITCRLGISIPPLQGFQTWELVELNEQQIEKLAQKWFNLDTNQQLLEKNNNLQYNQFLELLKRPENKLIKDLTKTPLLLSLLCSVFQQRANFPSKLSKLYQEALNILLSQGQSNNTNREVYELPLIHKTVLLTEIANFGFSKDYYYYEKQDLINLIIKYLQKTVAKNEQQLENLLLNTEAILSDFEAKDGLLIEIAKDIYTFSHFTFQEYLTAVKISQEVNIFYQLESLNILVKKIHKPQWHSVILITLEMLSEPEILINKLEQEITLIIEKNQKISDFFRSLEFKQKQLDLTYKPSAIIAFYLGLLYTNDLNLAIALDQNLASGLPEELALDTHLIRILHRALNLKDNISFENILTLGFILDFERKFTNLSTEFKQEINKLKIELLNHADQEENLLTWWQNDNHNWIDQLRNIIIKYRLIGKDWQFNQQDLENLQNYYNYSLFLINGRNYFR
jgi:predicted NACHT family NTPase